VNENSAPTLAILRDDTADRGTSAPVTNSLITAVLAPLRDQNFVSRLLVLMGLCMLGSMAASWLPYRLARVPQVAVYFLIAGYLLTYLCGMVRERDYRLPAWTNWKHLAQNGIAAYLIEAVYALPAVVLMYLTAHTLWNGLLRSLSETSGMADMWALSQSLDLSGGLIWVIIGLNVTIGFACMFFVPAAQALYAVSGNIVDAFRIPDVLRFVSTRWLAYATFIGVTAVAFIAAGKAGSLCLSLLSGYGALYSLRLLLAKTLCNGLMFVASLVSTAALAHFYNKNPR